RILWFDAPPSGVAAAAKAGGGGLTVIHDLPALGVAVLACDEAGLAALLEHGGPGRLMLDRDGVPALDAARPLLGVPRARSRGWSLGMDWSGTLAILDSGCDTAHGDLGDHNDDDRDGPPPAVGDADDWYPADNGWPLFTGYKVVGWADVTDDFPMAQGPWDYHHHGTALASAAAGSGTVDPAYEGVAPGARLTIVKFYDFDVTWHAWAGDFLAACAWLLDNHETYRVRTVLVAVNWDTEAGTSIALDRLQAQGLTVVAAMGNYGTDPAGPGYPARLPFVLSVGGVDDTGALAAFSGRGLPGTAKPDLVAPSGGLLQSAGRITAADNEPNDGYAGRFGTSLAAAQVAGAVMLLDEALRDRGVVLPPDRESARTRAVLLAATAQPLTRAETADGLGTVALPPWQAPDREQGWGLLRIDAAAHAACVPLAAGADQLDTLSADWSRPVAARRLATVPGVRYLVEAVPAPGLDVILEVSDPRGVIAGTDDASARSDAAGPGVSEFVHVRPGESRWLLLAVKRKSGAGTVTLRLREADTFAAQGYRHLLPGRLTGTLNHGRLGAQEQVALVVPSLVEVDQAARAVSVLAPDGSPLPGWPVYLFPPVSSQGGLTQPLVWDLDGVPGDEIVLASDYGAVVFLDATGGRTVLNHAFNVPLTAPVGLIGAAERRVASVDAGGLVRLWAKPAAAAPVLRAQRALGHGSPLVPAAGSLLPGGAESLVVACADGHVRVLDEDLADRAGWPRDLGHALDSAPLLVDLDGDGGREIVLVVRDAASGLATLRVLGADGEPADGDGTALATPGGGPWIALGPAAVTGAYATGDLGVSVVGLAGNGLGGSSARWTLARGVLWADGTAWAETLPGLEVRATTDEGQLVLDSRLLPAPVAWNVLGGTGTEAVQLASFHWTEVLYGLTSIGGAATGWYRPDPAGRPLPGWQPQERSGRPAG
ncbi:MAG: S8 family serine peptidase, partial [Krumholzibacteria bacterium]|nr:S8 family serine peptidase [Candidatus Krumholzibacteria bacterium]